MSHELEAKLKQVAGDSNNAQAGREFVAGCSYFVGDHVLLLRRIADPPSPAAFIQGWRQIQICASDSDAHVITKAKQVRDHIAFNPVPIHSPKRGLALPGSCADVNAIHIASKLFITNYLPSLVAPQGFEPRLDESESSVLPLNERATESYESPKRAYGADWGRKACSLAAASVSVPAAPTLGQTGPWCRFNEDPTDRAEGTYSTGRLAV
jgi:hypothetical protein